MSEFTIKDSLVSFKSPAMTDITSAKVYFEPVQDLHGYSNPWPAGGGKNLFDSSILTEQTAWKIVTVISTSGTYTMSTNKPVANDNNLYLFFRKVGSSTLGNNDAVTVNHSATVTLAEGESAEVVFRRSEGTAVFSDYWYQIELGSTATSYAPYENICPITGWTEATLYKTGKNLYSAANGGQYMYLALKQGSVITASCHLGGKITFYDKDKNAIEQYNMTSISNDRYYITITLENDCYYVRFNRQSGSQHCQLELGAQVTAYEPYNNGSAIPSEYQEVEYIQGTSNARIDTGVQGNNDDLVISGKVYLNKFSAYQGFFGNYIDEDHNTSRLILDASANGAVIVDINRRVANSSAPGVGFYAGNVGEFKVSKTKLIFNGTEYSYGGVNNATANDTNILLNVANPASTTSNSELYRRWYYFRINDGDTALRNYIPCYRKSDNKPGMYDTITNQFFASSGTEEFTAGPNVYYDTIPISWETEAGTVYGGYVDLVKGEVVATYELCNLQNVPSSNIFSYSYSNKNGIYFKNVLNKVATHAPGLCNMAPVSTETLYDSEQYMWFGVNTKFVYWVGILDVLGLGSVEDFVQWLGTNEVLITRELTTPITHQLTPGTIKTLKGINNIWGNTNSDTEITYEVADALKMTQIRKNILMSQPHVETLSSDGLLNFKTDVPANLKSCKINFAPIQEGSGDPSPDNVRPITGWDGVTVYKTGKNLFDKSKYYNLPSEYEYVDSSYKCKAIQLLPNTVYTLTCNSDTAASSPIILMHKYSHVNTAGFLDLRKVTDTKTFTTDSTGKLYIGTTALNTANAMSVFNARLEAINVQIELGTQATAYELYTGTSITIPFPQTIYGGYADLTKGEVVAEWALLEPVTVNGIINPYAWVYVGAYGTIDETIAPKSNLLMKTNGAASRIKDNEFNVFDSSGYNRAHAVFRIENVSLTSASYNEKLSELREAGTPLQFAYKLTTSTTYQLTPETIKTLRGINNIWSTGDSIQVSYWTH